MDEAEESTKNHKGSSIINISIVAIPSIDKGTFYSEDVGEIVTSPFI